MNPVLIDKLDDKFRKALGRVSGNAKYIEERSSNIEKNGHFTRKKEFIQMDANNGKVMSMGIFVEQPFDKDSFEIEVNANNWISKEAFEKTISPALLVRKLKENAKKVNQSYPNCNIQVLDYAYSISCDKKQQLPETETMKIDMVVTELSNQVIDDIKTIGKKLLE